MVVNYVGTSPTAIFSSAQSGMRAGQNQVAQASYEIARVPLYKQELQERSNSPIHTEQSNSVAQAETRYTPSSLVSELINLNEGELIFRANARSIEVAQVMFNTLLGQRQAGDQSQEMEHSR